MSVPVTTAILSNRTGRAAGCVLVALLCVLTTALFALADASAPKAVPSGSQWSRIEIVVAPQAGRDVPAAFAAARSIADSDNPFEHGRLPLADAGVPSLCLASSRPVVTADTGPIGAERPLPERPPRA